MTPIPAQFSDLDSQTMDACDWFQPPNFQIWNFSGKILPVTVYIRPPLHGAAIRERGRLLA